MSINESDSELTSEGGEKDVSADGEDAEGEDVEGNEEKEEVEAEAEEGGGMLSLTLFYWFLAHPS